MIRRARPALKIPVLLTAVLFLSGTRLTLAQCEVHEDAKLTASDAVLGDYLGWSVSVSGDVAVVGAVFDDCAVGDFCGSAYVYRFNGSTWVQEQKLTASDAAHGDLFGLSVSVSGDTVVVGAPYDDGGAGVRCGSAYVFRFKGSAWVQEQKLTASDAAQEDLFGSSVSVSGDAAVVGAHVADCGAGFDCGSAYVYRFNGSTWIEEQKLTAPDAAALDFFGGSVSVSGDVAVVGASHDDCAGGFNCGSAYVYRFIGSTWVQEQKLTASDAVADDNFGISVSISGDTVLVGAPPDFCGAGDFCGSAYVYRFNGSTWEEQAKLIASPAAPNDQFGQSVSVSGEVAVVGAATDACCGSAYIYRFNGSTWTQQAKLTASDAAASDNFGVSVSVSGDVAVVGTIGDDCAAGLDCGSAYVYALADCNANGIPDGCDIVAETSTDVNQNGVPDECDAPSIGWNSDPLSPDRTTRSLGFRVEAAVTAIGSVGQNAIKVTMVDLQNPIPPNAPCCPPQDFHTYESATCTAAGQSGGCARWVGQPGTFYETQGPPLAGPYRAARLQCSPFYGDWKSEGPIWVVGAEIMPSSTYSVQAYAASCVGSEPTCTNVSAAVTMYTRRSGDVEAAYSPPCACFQPDAIDVTQVVNKFKNVGGAPVKGRSQLQPNVPELNADLNALDIVAVVDAVKGLAYPFPGPCPCPSLVTCGPVPGGPGSLACPGGVGTCIGSGLPGLGPGAMCVKTCNGGPNDGLACINNKHCRYCVGGTRDGLGCETDTDPFFACPGGACPTTVFCGSGFCRDKCGRCKP
jgi:hypothetical protein